MKPRRFAVLQKVADAGLNVWRVLTEDGPLRDCLWCGLYANEDGATAHANKHRVDVDGQATVAWESSRVIQRRPPPPPFRMEGVEIVTVPAVVQTKAQPVVEQVEPVTAQALREILDVRPELGRRHQRLRLRAVYWRVRRLASVSGPPRR